MTQPPVFVPGAVGANVGLVPQAQPPRKPKKVRLKIEPEPAGQLEQLLIQWKQAKDKLAESAEAEAEYKAAIKAWVLSLFPGGKGLPEGFDITGDPHGRYLGLTMTLKGGRRVNTERMKQDGIYERYADESSPSWDLREATQGGRR